jgi:hypothetical protein
MPLPSRKALVERINQLEADIAPLAAAAGLGYVGGRLVPVATLARGASAVSPIGAAALLADLAIREQESLAYRSGQLAGRGLGAIGAGLTELEQFGQERLPVELGGRRKKRKKSGFNAAVAAGMKTVKASSSFGKKGTINNAKRAFSMVTKVASAVLKGKKASRSGPPIKRRLFNQMKKMPYFKSAAKIRLGTGKGR